MNEYPDTIIVKEKKTDIEKLKKEIRKKKDFYIKLYQGSSLASIISGSIFGCSIMAPDGFGTTINIACLATIGLGLLFKKISLNELDKADAILAKNGLTYDCIEKDSKEYTDENITSKAENIKDNKRGRTL